MASIKDLKNDQNSLVIDATGSSNSSNDAEVIDATQSSKKNTTSKNNSNKTVVNLNGMFEQPKGNHTNVTPNSPTQKRVQGGRVQEPSNDILIDVTGESKREIADLSDLPSMTPEEEAYAKEHYVDDPVDRMLEGEDSLLGKYLDNKEAELKTGYETVAYNKKKEELEEEAELTGDDSALIDFENENVPISEMEKSVAVVSDDDILSSLNKNKEEDNQMSNTEEEKVEETVQVEENIDFDLDEEESVEEETIEESDDEEPVEDNEEEDVLNNLDDVSTDEPTEEAKVEEEKPKKVEKPDIDLEVTQVENTGNDIINDIDESLEIEEEDTPESEDDSAAILQKLKDLATERLKPVAKRLDISSFTVIKQPISNTKQFNVNPVKAAKWVLMNQEATVMMKEFTGAELERLREFTQDGVKSVSAITKRYKLIYDHIDSPKPASFETWLKTTPFSDEDNYFFAIYIASFKEANYIPRDCSDQDSCKETWLTENINIMDMVKFEDEEAKNKFKRIYQEEDSSTTKAGLYVSERVALSNTVAVSFREPSIYTRIELASLDAEFREKYSAILEYVPYIDSLYLIDQEMGTLTPVGYKSFADNNVKTTKSKIQQFAKVLSTLSIDEFGTIRPFVNTIATRTNGLSYIIPECTCPKCNKIVEEVTTTAEELLFTRYQLGALVNTSLS